MNVNDALPHLPKIRTALQFAAPEWMTGLDAATGERVISTRETPASPVIDVARLAKGAPMDDADLLLNARLWLVALYTLFSARSQQVKQLTEELAELRRRAASPGGRDYAAECAMTCTRHDFRRYLIDRHQLPADASQERIVTRLRSILNIRSRAELNTDPAAALRWRNFKGDFEAWKKT
ncbi:hypothetical protein ACQ3G6_17375 [Allorhizobium undicola]|uniref:hypothetical protein n=1 Tax=Allorhizobium undicola TaxID=78527 RepID=UPI003D346CEC